MKSDQIKKNGGLLGFKEHARKIATNDECSFQKTMSYLQTLSVIANKYQWSSSLQILQ